MLLRFILYGLLGWCGEIVWTATREKIIGKQRHWKLQGTTYLWMFPIYGLLAPLYEPLHDAIRAAPWEIRGLTYMLGFFAVEYAAGWLLRRYTGTCPWDYTKHTRRHIHGLIRWDYAPAWFLAGLALEPVHNLLVQLTPAIQQAFWTP